MLICMVVYFRIEFLLIPAVALALLVNHDFTPVEVSTVYMALPFSSVTFLNRGNSGSNWGALF